MKNIVIAASISILMSACASTGTVAPAGEGNDFDTLIKQAEASVAKANATNGEWRDSAKFIKEAKEAKQAGDMDKAIKLAKKAKFEGDAGSKQAADQAKAGPWLF